MKGVRSYSIPETYRNERLPWQQRTHYSVKGQSLNTGVHDSVGVWRDRECVREKDREKERERAKLTELGKVSVKRL